MGVPDKDTTCPSCCEDRIRRWMACDDCDKMVCEDCGGFAGDDPDPDKDSWYCNLCFQARNLKYGNVQATTANPTISLAGIGQQYIPGHYLDVTFSTTGDCVLCGAVSAHARTHHRKICNACFEAGK